MPLNVLHKRNKEAREEHDFIMPAVMEQTLRAFYRACMDYGVDTRDLYSTLVADAISHTSKGRLLTALTGLKSEVLDTILREEVIKRFEELAQEKDKEL